MTCLSQLNHGEGLLTDNRVEMAFTAKKTALFAVFKASSSVTESFSSSLSVSISVYDKEKP